MRDAFKYLLSHWLELVVAAGLLYWDLRYFLFFLLAFHIFHEYLVYNELRRQTRVSMLSLEVKLMAINQKLGVSPAELQAQVELLKNESYSEHWASLEKDLKHFGIRT